jgi:hypothetical protein
MSIPLDELGEHELSARFAATEEPPGVPAWRVQAAQGIVSGLILATAYIREKYKGKRHELLSAIADTTEQTAHLIVSYYDELDAALKENYELKQRLSKYEANP